MEGGGKDPQCYNEIKPSAYRVKISVDTVSVNRIREYRSGQNVDRLLFKQAH